MVERKRIRLPSGDYNVGYGKPPKHSRFKPGQSGNRNGRPKGTRNLKTDVNAALTSSVTVTRDGKQKKISTQEAMLWRLKEKALNGDIRALNMLIGLAQTFNNEELPLREDLSSDDAALLGIYNARLLSGATGTAPEFSSLPEGSAESPKPCEEASRQPERDPQGRKQVRRIKRYRLQQKCDDAN